VVFVRLFQFKKPLHEILFGESILLTDAPGLIVWGFFLWQLFQLLRVYRKLFILNFFKKIKKI